MFDLDHVIWFFTGLLVGAFNYWAATWIEERRWRRRFERLNAELEVIKHVLLDRNQMA
jgi:hypothetical protein